MNGVMDKDFLCELSIQEYGARGGLGYIPLSIANSGIATRKMSCRKVSGKRPSEHTVLHDTLIPHHKSQISETLEPIRPQQHSVVASNYYRMAHENGSNKAFTQMRRFDPQFNDFKSGFKVKQLAKSNASSIERIKKLKEQATTKMGVSPSLPHLQQKW